MSTIEDIIDRVAKSGDDFARKSAEITRDTAVSMVNAAVIVAELHNQAFVPLATLKALADAIAGLPMPGDKPKEKTA